MFKKTFIVITTIIYFILVPGNLSILASIDYGIFGFLAYLLFIFGWIVPILFFYKKGVLTRSNLTTLIVVNVALSILMVYFGEIHGINKKREILERMRPMIESQKTTK